MASVLQAEKISKSYGTKVLFKDLFININEGDKIALIAPNGSGKSSLLKILAGLDTSDSNGSVKIFEGVKVAYLQQDPEFDPEKSVFDEVYSSSDKLSSTIAEYEEAIISGDQQRIEKAIHAMDVDGAWQYELKIKQILSTLKINNLSAKCSELSGGQRKRIALASMMIHEAEFIIMDEPTNHLDLEIIEILEEYLQRTQATILMVTHDRYFLDRVCNQILELENGMLFSYKGNYSYYLEKRQERIDNQNSETEKARNLLKGELEWMRRMPQARATKAKYRINAFYDLKEKASQQRIESAMKIDVKISRLGKKIIFCKGVRHNYEDICTIEGFNYNFARGEKIGIVGSNGTGKSTFLNVLTGAIPASEGEIERGETLVFGYYKQDGISFNPEDTVIDAVRKISETVTLSDGNSVNVTQFLTKFLFPHSMHNTKIERLSGGEKRRLYLVTVLMQNPNFLILDEPTNDLDIVSLNVLEEYLENFPGCLLIVSHDRYFLDKLSQHLFVFTGNGTIKDFPGNYSDYRDFVKVQERNNEKESPKNITKQDSARETELPSNKSNTKRKLTYKEQKELEAIELDIEKLESEKSSLEIALSSGTLSQDELIKASNRVAQVLRSLDEKTERWIELNE